MNCPKCNKIIHENMRFCPYCGAKMKEGIRSKNYDREDILIRTYVKQKQYSKILDMALKGNVCAEYVYITNTIGEENWHIGNKDYKMLSALCPNAVAMAIISIVGLFTVIENKTSIANETLEKYCSMVEQAAENGDPAALWAMGRFYLGTISNKYGRNEMKVYRYMNLAIDKKYPQAMMDLGSWHYTGENGMDKDEDRGILLFYKGMYYSQTIALGRTSEEEGNIFDAAQMDLEDLDKKIIQSGIECIADDVFGKKHKSESLLCINNKTEIELWERIRKYSDLDELEKMTKEIEAVDYSETDKESILHWLKKSVSEIKKYEMKVIEREKKRMEEERKQQELQERERNIKEANREREQKAREIIDSCSIPDDYLRAFDSVKELNMPEDYYKRYEEILLNKVKYKYSQDIMIAKQYQESLFNVKVFIGMWCVLAILGILLIKFLLWLSLYIGFLSYVGIGAIGLFGISYACFTYTEVDQDMKIVRKKSSYEWVCRFADKGYNFFDE
ncbi:MAG: zinc-ribbon domain-containing protein [Lachnospiraceae bacterium]|nr:zinc-ribbon domain-containing protein [Lachnospiraceae bacterium]